MRFPYGASASLSRQLPFEDMVVTTSQDYPVLGPTLKLSYFATFGAFGLDQRVYPPPTDYQLGEYWKQSVVQVKLGVIPANKQMMVTFFFQVPPQETNSVQVFVGQEYRPEASMDPVPSVNAFMHYARAVIVEGDGQTSVDVFFRPTRNSKIIWFEGARWEVF